MTSSRVQRLAAIDWMRGFVMVLMAIDHASQTWNAGRVNADSAYLFDPRAGLPIWIPGSEIDTIQFYTRWITHLCAPTFLFLSGTSLALSFEKRRREGMPESQLDRHLLIRAAVVLGFEGLLSLAAAAGVLILQVLYAISASMIAMVVLRRLPTRVLLGIGVGWLVGAELVVMNWIPVGPEPRSLWQVLFFVPSYSSAAVVLYPMLPWLAMMLLGWCFGRYLLDLPDAASDPKAHALGRQNAEKILLFAGLTALLLFAFLRSQNGFGNMGLLRDDTTVIQWLHVSKYPPALTFALLELGLMALFLVAFFAIERRLKSAPSPWNPLTVFGQTALFFYVLHFLILGGSAVAITGGIMQRGLQETALATAATLVVLYPICLGFRALKRRYPKSFLQFI